MHLHITIQMASFSTENAARFLSTRLYFLLTSDVRQRRQSGVHVCMFAKGATQLQGPQNRSEMGPMSGSKSLALWGRGPISLGGGGGGGGGGSKLLIHRYTFRNQNCTRYTSIGICMCVTDLLATPDHYICSDFGNWILCVCILAHVLVHCVFIDRWWTGYTNLWPGTFIYDVTDHLLISYTIIYQFIHGLCKTNGSSGLCHS